VATIWWKPPSKPMRALYLAMLLAACIVGSVQTFEDCSGNSKVPICCLYPWMPDMNARLETPHGTPNCNGLKTAQGVCLTIMLEINNATQIDVVTDSGEDLETVSWNGYVIPLTFSAVQETTRVVVIEAIKNNGTIWSTRLDKPWDISKATTCRSESITQYIAGEAYTFPPGCSGLYTYLPPSSVVEACDPNASSGCVFHIKTLNCAFIESEPLVIAPVLLDGENISDLKFSSVGIPDESDVIRSQFYSFFRMVGMAGLLECSFTLYGILLKLIFLSECRSLSIQTASLFMKRRKSTLVADLRRSGLSVIQEEE
jgi:hypothetical protein